MCYCLKRGIVCEYTNNAGSCSITACIKSLESCSTSSTSTADYCPYRLPCGYCKQTKEKCYKLTNYSVTTTWATSANTSGNNLTGAM